MSASHFGQLTDDEMKFVKAACEDFEQAFLKQVSVSIEDHIAAAPQRVRDTLFRELLAIELELRSTRGGTSDPTQYDTRFPDRLDQVREVFERLAAGVAETRFEDPSLAAGSDISSPRSAATTERPTRIGRYRVDDLLGEGGFGLVYKAYDADLDRTVALKVPHPELASRRRHAELYLAEAKAVARLDHPNIAAVFDVGSDDDVRCYIVSKYIDGMNLAMLMKQQRPGYGAVAELIAAVADALQHAHENGLVHRDVKPSNILIDGDGTPYLTDFGLALREEDLGKGPRYAGTAAYMSPEQARGEGHRVDGRSDIFALGVVMYELLVGRRPFRGDTKTETLDQVIHFEPRPLRQYDERLPKELARICHKAMAKRASERYSSASEMAEDLRYFLTDQTMVKDSTAHGPLASVTSDTKRSETVATAISSAAESQSLMSLGSSQSQAITIIPKGLRSFDAYDADFFLELLPGPRDRNGLPDNVRFWKTHIEEMDPDNTFSVGLIYGPSGCGKSSMVKAGLLPRLSDHVTSVYVEATPDETETRLLRELRKRCPAVPDNLDLKETLAALRRGEGMPVGTKVLIVIDQLEQWLHAKHDDDNGSLVQGLRQCDGGHVQCIIMVRDDFWLAVSRFVRALEVRLVEGENSALSDLFDTDHARKVLVAFGQAFGKLSHNIRDATQQQKEFLTRAVAGLAVDGKVVCVRLALFAEMMKGRPWTSATLEQVGGTTGVGVSFLEDTFSASTAPPEHRYHQGAARGVLKALLPESGMDLKGEMKSRAELMEASGYNHRRDFDDVIRILDRQLRLITPTDTGGVPTTDDGSSQGPANEKYYQLTHDYLVHSLRDWLTRKQRETRRGRAELRLADRSALWNTKQENRYLPSWWENIQLRLFTNRRDWTQAQRKMMLKAGRVHGLRSILAIAVLVAIGLLSHSISRVVTSRQQLAVAQTLVDSLGNADIAQVPAIVIKLGPYRDLTRPILSDQFESAPTGSSQKLRAALALLSVDDRTLKYVLEQLPICTQEQFAVLRDALLPHKETVTEPLWDVTFDEQHSPGMRFQAATAIALYAPDDPRWEHNAPFVVHHLATSIPTLFLAGQIEHLEPVSKFLTAELETTLRDRSEDYWKQREVAAIALARYLNAKPERLADLVLIADAAAEFSPLIDALRPNAERVQSQLRAELLAEMPLEPTEQRRDAHWERQAIAAVALLRLGDGELVWPLMQFNHDPSLRSNVIRYLGKLGADPNLLASQLDLQPDTFVRRALIVSLGCQDASLIPTADQNRIGQQLKTLHLNDHDPGIHGATAWTLRQWGQTPPKLPSGEAAITQEQESRRRQLADKAELIQQRLVQSEHELPQRQIAWETQLRQQSFGESKLNEGLVLHYPLDDALQDTAQDATDGQSAGGYQGTGEPDWVPGVIQQGLHLRGTDDMIGERLPQVKDDQSFSLGCWFFADEKRGGILLSNEDPSNGHRGIELGIYRQEYEVMVSSGESGSRDFPMNRLKIKVAAPPGFPEPYWQHIFATYDGSRKSAGLQLYLNGVAQTVTIENDAITGPIDSEVPLRIGARSPGALRFRGGIDDVRVYDRCLGPDEIKSLFQSGIQSLAASPRQPRTGQQEGILALVHAGADEQLRELRSQLADTRRRQRFARTEGARRWFVNSEGQTMMIISPRPEFGVDQIDHDFAISAYEVTMAEFLRFRSQHEVDPNVAPSSDCPAHNVNLYLAAQYCNWLSEQEGILPDQWVYQPNVDGLYADGMKIKQDYEQLLGYRLPTAAEWDYACRGGTTSNFGFGESAVLLEYFGWYAVNSAGRTHSVGSLFPNEFGLFDMHGNTWEWGQTPDEDYPDRLTIYGRERWCRFGGGYNNQPIHTIASHRHRDPPAYASTTIGIRLVKAYP